MAAKSKRSGESYYHSRRSLPRAHESVRLDESVMQSMADFEWGMGQSPISAYRDKSPLSVEVFNPPPFAKRSSFRPRNPFQELRELWMRAPSRVRFCVQRKQRREVLFAKRRAGFSGSAKKARWRRTQNSQYRC